jgi:hypothetical protein
MSLHDDSRCIWVAPGEDSGGEGTFANPFHSLPGALDCAVPGQTIVLAQGIYEGDITIQKSGTIDKPLRIIAEEPGKVIWIGSCWYFYDASDIVCSGLIFKESPGMAVSVVGACCRNCFDTLTFIDCGTSPKESCTFFFGGSGQSCNILESCCFVRQAEATVSSIGVLLSEGDIQGALPNCNTIVNNTAIENYSYGILVGTHGTIAGEYGHRITNNTILHCSTEGIMVKCGDTLVSGNTIAHSSGYAVSVVAGNDCVIENNRIIDAGTGIRIAGNGHVITNNCIVRCREEALQVLPDAEPSTAPAGTLFVEDNTFIDWGTQSPAGFSAGIHSASAGICIVRNNIFHGSGSPVAVACGISEEHAYFVDDNSVSGGCMVVSGCRNEDVVFASAATDDYTAHSRHGAQGWVLSPDTAGRDKATIGAAGLSAAGDDDCHDDDGAIGSSEEHTEAFSALYSWFNDTDIDSTTEEPYSDNDAIAADDSEYTD